MKFDQNVTFQFSSPSDCVTSRALDVVGSRDAETVDFSAASAASASASALTSASASASAKL